MFSICIKTNPTAQFPTALFLWPLLSHGTLGCFLSLLASQLALPTGIFPSAVARSLLSALCLAGPFQALQSPKPSFCLITSSHCHPFLGAKQRVKVFISFLFLVMDITDIIKGKSESDEEKQHFIPFHP
jgi:hypothetical protein